MLNYLPAYVQLHFHRLREWSINRDEQICVPCPIIASCRHNHPGRVTKTQAALTPVLLHLSVHPSQFTPLFLLVPIKTKCQMEVGKKHLWKQKKKRSRTGALKLHNALHNANTTSKKWQPKNHCYHQPLLEQRLHEVVLSTCYNIVMLLCSLWHICISSSHMQSVWKHTACF